ncbi:late embryogenesis abundant protein D-34-like [Punica granatum]|uniref:SMP domain-containing protein n=2 Tax=Punica granatum TaxID=22663 RepID=A0A218WPW8_PUNGR|nr:late embryogenesis abundant protein D-34-like [Punica granatum]OWM74271.1 hypothetical protein CDL15_Pgr008585 [Punica granatum]PKI70181.1 hypothetical protein CRG98_009431 [Punica granatum]
MSQEQPQRPQQQEADQGQQERLLEPIKYGDVFNVSGDLASKPIAPEDAAMMQTAEAMVFGQTQKDGPAAVIQSAAPCNERAGLVGHRDITDVTGDQGVTIIETDVPGSRIITESIAGQVVGQYVQFTPVQRPGPAAAADQSTITIGEALEAAAQTMGGKPVDQSDAAAIQAAEVRATGSNVITPGGLAALAQSAAAHNEQMLRDEDKIKLSDILTDATVKLAADKVATRQDAEEVISVEIGNNPNLATQPGGVAASVAAAARLNENVTQ